jgi:hypothetical protein
MVDGKKGSRRTLRVMSEEGAVRAVPSIAMPRAKTELTELLAGDDLLCVRRPRSVAAGQANTDPRPEAAGTDAAPQTESLCARPADGDLACVIDAWPGLPRNVRAAILAMVREAAAGNA